jgi:Protein of unknown function (DUF3995)
MGKLVRHSADLTWASISTPGLRARGPVRLGSVPVMPLTARLMTCILAALSALHVAWAFGSPFPLRNRQALADAVVGTRDFPSPRACVAVAGALATGAVITADTLPIAPGLRRSALRTLAVILGVRGVFGLVGRTEVLSPGSNSVKFRRFDRRIYAPICLFAVVWSRCT